MLRSGSWTVSAGPSPACGIAGELGMLAGAAANSAATAGSPALCAAGEACAGEEQRSDRSGLVGAELPTVIGRLGQLIRMRDNRCRTRERSRQVQPKWIPTQLGAFGDRPGFRERGLGGAHTVRKEDGNLQSQAARLPDHPCK